MRDKIKTWYHSAYPTDDMWTDIHENVTFRDLFDALDHYRDVYDCIGACDSLIRERCFERLSEILDCDYSYIYDQWLLSAN